MKLEFIATGLTLSTIFTHWYHHK